MKARAQIEIAPIGGMGNPTKRTNTMSLFKLNIVDGRVTAEQTILDKDGKEKALKGEPSRIDADTYEAIGQAAIVVARSVGEHDDAVRLHRDAAGHDSKTLAA